MAVILKNVHVGHTDIILSNLWPGELCTNDNDSSDGIGWTFHT